MTEQTAAIVADEPVVAPEKIEETPIARDYAKEASEMGWVPEDQFRGDKSKWKDAETFVKHGEDFLPIVKSQLAKEREERAKEREETKARFDRIERNNAKVFERAKAQYKAEIDSLKAQQRQAVEMGDVQAFEALEKRKEALKEPEVEPEISGPQVKPDDVFKKSNPWFGVDEDMTAFAVAISNDLANKNPNITLEDNLKQTEARVKTAFPSKFTKAAGNAHSAVDPGGNLPGLRKTGKSSADLPPEAKAAGSRFVKDGLFKDIEAYAKDYFND